MTIDEKIKNAFENKKYASVIKETENYLKSTKKKLSEETLQYYLKSLSFYGLFDKMVKYLRWKTPKPYKGTKDYRNNISIIKDTINNKNISESILFDYYVSLIKVGEFKKANYILKSIQNLYPQYMDNFLQVIMLLRCNNICDAFEIIEKSNFNGNQLMKIAITYFMIGQYHKSQQILSKARSMKFSSQYDEMYEKMTSLIEKHKKTGKFIMMRYEYFKTTHELYRGDVIYVADVDEEYKKIDSYALNRTYMIWKIEKDTIYAFPVTNKIPKDIRRFKLFRQNYLNFDSDRSIKDDLVIIKENDVQKVQERLTGQDYANVLSNIYTGLIVCGNEDKKEKLKMFLEEYFEYFDIQKNNIVVAYSHIQKQAKKYLVIDTNDEFIYGLEVETDETTVTPVNYRIIQISKRQELLRVLPNNKKYIDDINAINEELEKRSISNSQNKTKKK